MSKNFNSKARQAGNKGSFFVLIGKFTSRKGVKFSDKYLVLSLFFAIVFSLNFYSFSYFSSINAFLNNVAFPVKHFANNIIEIPKLISEYMDIKRENKRLKLELDDLKIKTLTAEEIIKELKELKKAVNLKYSIDNFCAIERVLGFDKSIYNSFLIISSTHEETKKGSAVISSDGLVGIVFDTIDEVARVVTISDERASIPVMTGSGDHLIISGNGNNKIITKAIREEDSINKIKVGDKLVTSGEGGTFRSNIPVAEVINVNKEKNEIIAKPICEISNISFVWALKPFYKEK